MSKMLEKLKNNSTIKKTQTLSKSKFFDVEIIPTRIPALNIVLSGAIDGGFCRGLTFFCGPSKHFKTSFALILVKAYMDKYPDSVLLFYDSEFGAPQDYFKSFGIDTDRVLHTPIKNIEELKFDLIQQLETITEKDKVIIMVDSIGNLPSKKEIDDAIDKKSVADMTRAKALKGLFRMVTPYLTMNDIPLVAINHCYDTQELYSKQVMSGGKGAYYSANSIFMVGRQQEKEGSDVIGYSFIINVDKSRFVREKAKVPITVLFDGGISRWSGLIDLTLESGHVVKPSNGWYSKVNVSTGEIEEKKYRLKETFNKEFWMPILKDKTFKDWIETNYKLTSEHLMSGEDYDEIENN